MCVRGFYVKVLQLQHVAIHVPILPFHHRLPRPPGSFCPLLLDLLILVVESKRFPLYEEKKNVSKVHLHSFFPYPVASDRPFQQRWCLCPLRLHHRQCQQQSQRVHHPIELAGKLDM
jgi:hypothetical protein